VKHATQKEDETDLVVGYIHSENIQWYQGYQEYNLYNLYIKAS
jgi:hypothetical protein